jgi:signal peptidase II
MTDPQDGSSAPVGGASDAAAPSSASVDAPAQPGPATLEAQAFPEPASGSDGAPPTLLTGVTPTPSQAASDRPTFRFFGIVAAVSLVADVGTKAWAEVTLQTVPPRSIEILKDHLSFTLAYNPGGAWGLFQHHSELVRRPFFLAVSLLAIAFIINLYGRLTSGQRALKWGLPLVLGGALGNLSDRIVRSNVIDFIDYQANWIEQMNRLIAKVAKGWAITNHWPTFNVADIAICVGVGLMAVDMFTSRRGVTVPPPPPTGLAGLPTSAPEAPPLGSLSAQEANPPLKPEA